MDKIALIDELINETKKIEYQDWNGLDKLKKRVAMIFGNLFPKRDYVKKLDEISFSPMIYTFDENAAYEIESWESGKHSLLNLLLTIKEEIELFDIGVKSEAPKKSINNNIFIVHGHDEAMKLDVADFLKQLSLYPIILHEQPDKGRNVLDKLIDESSNASFAIILLSPDDFGYPKTSDDFDKKSRARQNVVLELGYFIGKLKKENVLALYRECADFELPSDFIGTLYKKYNNSNGWKMEVAKELKAAGVKFDMNNLI